MYIQITDHCNMACQHCCYSCSPRKKNFMTKNIYMAALDLANSYGETVAIGGGEPTTHPDFWEFFGLALGERNIEYVWMATNGKIGRIARALAGLAAGSERFGVALSQDAYHEPIDPETVQVFRDNNLEIRNVMGRITMAGRAKRTMVWDMIECGCEDVFICPDGGIWSCGCKKLLLGTVQEPETEMWKRYISGHDDLRYSVGECLFINEGGAAHNKRIVNWIKTGRGD